MTVKVHLYRPSDIFGRLIAWRLESDYCHATIEIDEEVYSATFPTVLQMSPYNKAVAFPPREGQTFEITLSDQEKEKALLYLRSMIGTSYDVLAIFGWAFRIQSMQRPNHVYCFEYVYDALAACGVFDTSKRFVSGNELIEDLYVANRVVSHKFGSPLRHANYRSYKVPSPKL